jgi:hypothetical protein
MRKYLLLFFIATGFLFTSCNNSADTPADSTKKTKADTLMDEVMDGHNVGMGKMGKLTRAQQEVTRILDSIANLPAKARDAAAPYKANLENLLSDLKSADNSMNQWMENFNMDSALNNAEERIRYLGEEKLKVGKVKESILNSLKRADSVLKKNF